MTIHRTRTLVPAALVAAALALGGGCAEQKAGAAPSAAQSTLMTKSAAALGVAKAGETTSSQAVEDDGSGNAASTASARNRAKAATAPTFSYQASFTQTIDLDSLDANGNDIDPNASGIVTVNATGSVMGDEFKGTVAYTVNLTSDTDILFDDPASDAAATLAAGAVLDYGLVIDWDKIDDQNWTLRRDADVAVSGYDVTVTDASETVNATVDGTRNATVTLSATEGVFSFERDVVAHWTITVSSGGESHTIVWDRPSLDQITITVDGESFGPYTRFQLLVLHGITVDDGE